VVYHPLGEKRMYKNKEQITYSKCIQEQEAFRH
jgi:hypothetical protein